ncbi:glycosyl transferase family 1, partial [Escherichia coli]
MQIEDNVFKKVYRVKLSPLYSYLNVLLSIPTNIPLQIAYYKSTKFRKLIDELLPEHDACIAHLIRVGDYIKDKKGIRILEMTDAISLNYKRVKINKNTNLRSIIYSIEQKRLEHYERKMASHFDLVSFVSH